jgi:uncharacterized oxidoreductase
LRPAWRHSAGLARATDNEVSGVHVWAAYTYTINAAERLGRRDEVRERIRTLVANQLYMAEVLGRELGLAMSVHTEDSKERDRAREIFVKDSDVSDPRAIAALNGSVLAQFPALDTLVNNAGIMRNLNLNQERDLNDVTREIEINLSGPVRMVQQFLPHLKTRESALIVNVSSGLAFVPLPLSPVYCATKAAIHSFTQSLRVQLDGTSVTVIELAPPGVETPLFRGEFAEEMQGQKGMDVKVLVKRAITGIEAGKLEIRPGLSNVLKAMSRIAPALMRRCRRCQSLRVESQLETDSHWAHPLRNLFDKESPTCLRFVIRNILAIVPRWRQCERFGAQFPTLTRENSKGENKMKKVLMIGLHPDVVEYSSFPDLTKEKLTMALEAQGENLRGLSFDARWCLIDLGKTAEAVAKAALEDKQYDVVLIGAGVRTPTAYLSLFEKLINIVHEYAPKSRICFNTRPDDTTEAVLRWATP